MSAQKKQARLLQKAIEIAVEAHRGQIDDNGLPYVLHPLKLMAAVDTADEKIVAILHDVVEDTRWKLKDLKKAGFSKNILHAIDCITKRDGESYDDFTARAASDPIARKVKLADLADNMDVRRWSSFDEGDLERLEKYQRAWWRIVKGEV